MSDINFNINININELDDDQIKKIKKLFEQISGVSISTNSRSSKSKKTKKSKSAKTQFKILKSEKEIMEKKEEIKNKIIANPDSMYSKVVSSIFRRVRFSLYELREEFPKYNYATIRNYVNTLKKEGVIVELDRGKYVVK